MDNWASQKVMRSIRVPIFLDKDIIDRIEKLPKVTNVSSAYIYFINLGVKAFDQHALISSDPEKSEKAKNQIDSIFAQKEMIDHLRNIDPSQLKALTLAVEFANMQEKK